MADGSSEIHRTQAEEGHGATNDRREHNPFSTTGEQRVNQVLTRAFAPMDKAALGAATGIVFGVLLALLTLCDLAVDPQGAARLDLLAEYFYGYTVSMTGAAIILGWGFLAGFVAGWFLAFARNAVMAVWVLYFRARAEWLATKDFLDFV